MKSPPRLAIQFLSGAAKDLEGIPLRTAENILTRIERDAEGAPSDIKKLKGCGEFRLRVGDYRVLLVKTGGPADSGHSRAFPAYRAGLSRMFVREEDFRKYEGKLMDFAGAIKTFG